MRGKTVWKEICFAQNTSKLIVFLDAKCEYEVSRKYIVRKKTIAPQKKKKYYLP